MRGPKAKDGTEFCEVFVIHDKFLEQFQNFNHLYESYHDYYVQDDVPGIDVGERISELNVKISALDPENDKNKIKRINSMIEKLYEKDPTAAYDD